jgi:hypothetical protein
VILFRAGDTWRFAAAFQRDGLAADMTGWTIAAQLDGRWEVTLPLILTGAWANAAVGAGTITQTAANTTTWPAGQYTMKIRITAPDSEKISVLPGIPVEVVL